MILLIRIQEELLIYNLRHVHGHASQLNMLPGQNNIATPDHMTRFDHNPPGWGAWSRPARSSKLLAEMGAKTSKEVTNRPNNPFRGFKN